MHAGIQAALDDDESAADGGKMDEAVRSGKNGQGIRADFGKGRDVNGSVFLLVSILLLGFVGPGHGRKNDGGQKDGQHLFV